MTLPSTPPDATAIRGLYESLTLVANESVDVAEALHRGLRHVCETMGWPVGHALLVEGRALVPTRIWHLDEPEPYETFRAVTESVTFHFDDGSGPLRRTARSAAPTWLADIEEEPDFQRARLADDIGVRGALIVPVLIGDETTAVLEFYSPRPVEPDRDVLEVMRHVGVQLGRVFERRRVKEAEQQALDAERRYLRIAAHDMRTPLAIAGGYLELLREDDLDEAVRREALDALARGLENLGRLARNFLVDARLHGGTMRAHIEPCDTLKVVSDALGDVPAIAATASVHCDDDLRVLADAFLLRQALVNLLTNAETHGQPPFLIAAERTDATVEISVVDHGPGIAEGFVPDMFERFSRGREDVEGFGLGLEIVARLTELQGGRVRYEPNEPTGARFTIALPQPIT